MAIPTDLIDGLAREAMERLAGRRLRKLHHVVPYELILSFQGEGARLLVTARPPWQRVQLVWDRPAASPGPSPFARRLRAALGGRRLTSLGRPGEDRTVVIAFGEGAGARRLVAEIFGPRGNVILLEPDGTIGAALFPLRRGGRILGPGDPYAPPPPGRRGSGAGAAAPAIEPEARADESLSRACAARFGTLERGEAFRSRRARIARAIRRALAAARRAREAVEEDRAAAAEAGRLRRFGELLKGALGAIPRGADRVRLPDGYGPGAGEVEIPLRPDLSPLGNAEVYFRRYRKAKAARAKLDARAEALAQRVARLEAGLRELESIAEGDAEALEGAAARLGIEPRVRPAASRGRAVRPRAAARARVRRFLSRDGLEILVGRSARDNEALLARVARGRDIFLHVAGWPGPFVIVRMPRDRAGIPAETLRDAAALAVHYGRGRGAGPLDVDWTEVKHVQRVRGGPPGRVRIARCRTVRAAADPKRIARLRSRAGAPGEIDRARGG